MPTAAKRIARGSAPKRADKKALRRTSNNGHAAAQTTYSPSLLHVRLMEQNTPDMTFAGGDVKAWQRKLRGKIAELSGLDRIDAGPRVPLKTRSLWKQDDPIGSIEKIVFTAEPGSDVPAYVCLPHGIKPPYRFVICLQGHSTGMHVSIARQRDSEFEPYVAAGDRDFAIGAMKRGLAALCIEQRSFGLRRELDQKHIWGPGCLDAVFHALMLGRTLLGERVFDVDRGIDYLATRDDVDMSSLGVMGNSGGGTISVAAAAMLPRLAWAMPSCSFCTFADSIMRIMHCGDNYIPSILLHAEMADMMGTFAPKPVTIVNGRHDDIFPIAGVKRAFSHLQRIYRAAGAADRCKLVIGKEGHRFYADDAWPVMFKLLGWK